MGGSEELERLRRWTRSLLGKGRTEIPYHDFPPEIREALTRFGEEVLYAHPSEPRYAKAYIFKNVATIFPRLEASFDTYGRAFGQVVKTSSTLDIRHDEPYVYVLFPLDPETPPRFIRGAWWRGPVRYFDPGHPIMTKLIKEVIEEMEKKGIPTPRAVELNVSALTTKRGYKIPRGALPTLFATVVLDPKKPPDKQLHGFLERAIWRVEMLLKNRQRFL